MFVEVNAFGAGAFHGFIHLFRDVLIVVDKSGNEDDPQGSSIPVVMHSIYNR